jgi:hypothetical protein
LSSFEKCDHTACSHYDKHDTRHNRDEEEDSLFFFGKAIYYIMYDGPNNEPESCSRLLIGA